MQRRLKDQENMHIQREEASRSEIIEKEEKLKEKLRKKISRLEY